MIEELVTTSDLPDEAQEGVEFRVEIPTALYATVRTKADLETLLTDLFGEAELYEIDSTEGIVLYPGWSNETVGIADVWE